jgi:CDP-diacylglycerol--glycerol-3-phosphate 3-phosphatidyltransferase
MNAPNKLSIARVILTPIFTVFLVYPVFGNTHWGHIICTLVAAAIFGAAALTDYFDGKIARRDNIITKFGVFIDPLADKFMIFCAMIGILASSYMGYIGDGATAFGHFYLWCSLIIIFRELAVTSMRLVVAGESGIVVPANIWGKIKTVSQIVAVLVTLAESLADDAFLLAGCENGFLGGEMYFSIVAVCVATVSSILSGMTYIKSYWSIIKP